MADRDEIIRRIISGDMSRGGADFAARMMQQRVTPEDLLAQYPTAPAPQPTFGFGGMMPKQATLDRIQANADAQMAAQRAGLEATKDQGMSLPPGPETDRTRMEAWQLAAMADAGDDLAVRELQRREMGQYAQAGGIGSPAVSDVPVPSQADLAYDSRMLDIRDANIGRSNRVNALESNINSLQQDLALDPTNAAAQARLTELLAAQAAMPAPPRPASAGLETVPGFEFMSGGIGMPEGMDPLGMPEIGMGGAAMVPAMLDGGPTGTPLASPQAGLPTPPGPMMLPAVTPPGGGGGTGGVSTGGTGGSGGIDMASLPSAADVSPSNPEAYNPETGTRPPEARALSIWDRMFGEPGTDRRSAMSQALMQMGAVMMSTNGNLGQALGAGIQAGLLEYDQTMQALADEAMEAKKMGMEEEAHELNMALKELQLARARSGGGGGGVGARTSGVVENPFESKASDFAAWSALLDTDPRFAGLNPEVKNRIALNQSGFITAGSIMNGQNPDPLAAYLE